jgi:hypothetical protein
LQSVNQQLGIMQKNGMLRAIISKWIPVTVEVTDAKPEAIPTTLPKTPAASTMKSIGSK